jgi:hypothetical protein
LSRFNEQNTRELAKRAVRLGVQDSARAQRVHDRATPLDEVQFGAVLREAEEFYDDWLDFEPVLKRERKLIARFPTDCEKLEKHIQSIIKCWFRMGEYRGHHELASMLDLTREDEIEFIQRTMKTLQQMLRGAELGAATSAGFSYRGSPGKSSGPSLEALKQFTKVVRRFWIREVSESFGYEEARVFDEKADPDQGRREPVSAAARLIDGAAAILDKRYTIGHVREAVEAANRDPNLHMHTP